MRALRKTAPRPGAELGDVPVPEPGEGEVLVRVHAASICGTDLHIFDWNEWAQGRVTRVPMTFGHEVAGTVEAVGPEVHHVQRGAFVAVETHIACGRLLHLPDRAGAHLPQPARSSASTPTARSPSTSSSRR